jgi:hypothetical protein
MLIPRYFERAAHRRAQSSSKDDAKPSAAPQKAMTER